MLINSKSLENLNPLRPCEFVYILQLPNNSLSRREITCRRRSVADPFKFRIELIQNLSAYLSRINAATSDLDKRTFIAVHLPKRRQEAMYSRV